MESSIALIYLQSVKKSNKLYTLYLLFQYGFFCSSPRAHIKVMPIAKACCHNRCEGVLWQGDYEIANSIEEPSIMWLYNMDELCHSHSHSIC